jgi:hypothetical protein
MVANFLISTAVSFGASALLSLFNKQTKPVTQREVNRLENFDYPNSAYGENIPDIYGKVRVRGIYVAAQVPPDWERDDYFDPVARETILTYIYYGNLGVLWAANPPLDDGQEVKKIWFNRELYYSNGSVDGILGTYWGRFAGLEVANYYGDQTSSDPTLNFMGSNQIAYHGRCYSAIKRLRLNNSDGNLFNSRYPDLEAAIDTHASGNPIYLGEIIGKILEKAGYTSDQFDTTELDTVSVRGFVAYPSTVADKLTQLQWAYNFEVVDTGESLKFIKQNRPTSSVYFSRSQMAGREDGSERGDVFTEEIDQDIAQLPTQVRIKFSDFNNDYLPGEKVSFEIVLSENKNIEEVDLSNLTLTETEALNIANRILLLAWQRRRTYKFSVLGRYCGLEAGDVINCEFRDGDPQFLQIKRLNHGANGVIEIEAYAYDSTIYNNQYTAVAAQGETATATQGTPIALAQQNIYAVSVYDNLGNLFVVGTDYTVNTTTGTVTPTIGGGITNGTAINISYGGQPTPATPPPPINLPSDPYANLPKVLSFSPSQGAIGSTITIVGSKFTGATGVTIDGVAMTGLTVVNDLTLTAIVGASTTTGKIVVTNPAGTGQSLTDFVIVSASGVDWGGIGGTLADQEDLQTELDDINTALAGKLDNPTGTTSQYLRGDGSLETFPTIYANIFPYGGFIETIANKTYPLFKPDRSYKILNLRVKSASGTCAWAIQINGTNVTGLSAVSVTSTEQLVTATAANTVTTGQRVTIVSTANSAALDVEFTIMLEAL